MFASRFSLNKPIPASDELSRLGQRCGEEGGILTPAYSLSHDVFSSVPENRMDAGDFYGLAFCNSFNCSV
jgi:hypothetical protein